MSKETPKPTGPTSINQQVIKATPTSVKGQQEPKSPPPTSKLAPQKGKNDKG